ncbi:hypothetical protein [Nonomuraea dietziae]
MLRLTPMCGASSYAGVTVRDSVHESGRAAGPDMPSLAEGL